MVNSYVKITISKALINDLARKFIEAPIDDIRVDFKPQNWFLKMSIKGKEIKVQGRLKASGPDLISFRIDSVKVAFLPIPVNGALVLAWPWIKKKKMPFIRTLELVGGTIRLVIEWPENMPLGFEIVEIEPGDGEINLHIGPPGSHPTKMEK